MRVVVFVFLYFKSPVLQFKFYADVYVYIYVILLIFIIFYIAVAEFTQAIHKFSLFVNQRQYTNIVFLTHFIVICPKSRRGVHNAGTVFGSYKAVCHHPEWFCTGCDVLNLCQSICFIGQQLLIAAAFQLPAFTFCYYFPGNHFIAFFPGIKISVFGLFFKIFVLQCFCQYNIYRQVCIRIKCLYKDVINIATHC